MQDKLFTNSGSKARQRMDTEDRKAVYSDFHRSLHPSLVAIDVDYVEFRKRNGEWRPVAILEITRVDSARPVSDNYKLGIIERYVRRDMQSKLIRIIATALNVPVYIVLHRADCSGFWTYSLTEHTGFGKEMSRNEYHRFLSML